MKQLITLLLIVFPLCMMAQSETEIRKALDAYDFETL